MADKKQDNEAQSALVDAQRAWENDPEMKKIRGETESQQAERDYHETTFQKEDPVTGEERDLDATAAPVRLDRGEALTHPDADADADADASDAGGDDYDNWSVEDLRAEAGDLEVRRSKGEGAPLKADYIKALRKRDRR